MNRKDNELISGLICDYFVRPIKGYGATHDDIAAEAMRFCQRLLRVYPDLAEEVSLFEIEGNEKAGSQFLDELSIKYFKRS